MNCMPNDSNAHSKYWATDCSSGNQNLKLLGSKTESYSLGHIFSHVTHPCHKQLLLRSSTQCEAQDV